MSLVTLKLANEKTAYFDGNTYSYKDMIKAVAGSRWEKKAKRWEVPLESTPDVIRILPTIVIDEDVKKTFGSMQKRQEKAVSLKTTETADGKVKGLKGELRPYQAVGKAFLDTLDKGEGAILAFDMGLGKSLTSLGYGLNLINKGVIDHILVVCPSPLKYATWEKEVQKWTKLDYIVVDGDKREIVEWEDGTKERLTGSKLRAIQYQQYAFGSQVTIMNYELFLRDYDIIPTMTDRWLVILDEAHRIKNPKAQTTKNLIKKLKPAGRKVLGTGTPLENNIQELWSLVDFCRPNLLGNYYKFLDRYVEMDYFGKPLAPKPQMMPELMKKIDPIMIRKTKAEAMPDLPPLTVQEYWVDMTKEQEKLYKSIKDGIIENAATGDFSYMEVIVQITRLQQVLDSPAILRKLTGDPDLPEASGKLNELANLVEDMKGKKFVLFSQYREMTDILYRFLQEECKMDKSQIGYVKGGLKPSETKSIQTGFQEGDIQCVLMTTAGNYGLDLSAGSYVICYDQLFNPQKMEQIYARCHRSGVKNAVTAINLVTRHSYEEKKLKVLEGKRAMFKAVIDADDTAFAKLFTKEELLDMI